mgnify:CR=1 FL=1
MRCNDTCHREPHIDLIAVPTVNLIKNKLPEHADLLGVYGGVSNQEIADYLKTHDR